MNVYTIMTGNSDNKLTQLAWTRLVNSIREIVSRYAEETFFHGHSNPNEPWQNACWVVKCMDEIDSLQLELESVARQFKQDSIAFVTGSDTRFLG